MAEAAFTIEYMASGELVPNPHNFRRHPEAQRRALSSSIAEHGWVDAPLFNRTSGHLIDGHARVEEALAAGEARIKASSGLQPGGDRSETALARRRSGSGNGALE